jgi:3-oxoadipate enol-lactonase
MALTTSEWLRLPPGRTVDVAGRGRMFVRELSGPPAAPTVVLLHGVTLTADLNWFGVFGSLGHQFRVVAPDLRGHGRTPLRGRFRLIDVADDVAALVEALGLRRVIVVGYSMGGLVAQLVWQRHRRLVDGLVLCATARNFRGSREEGLMSLSLMGFTRAMRFNPFLPLMGSGVLASAILGQVHDSALRSWAHSEMERTSLATTSDAFDEVARFTSHEWIGTVDVPTAVVITLADHVVPVSRQRRLAAAIPGASVHRIDGDHGVCVDGPDRFAATLLGACRSVLLDGTAGP